MDPTHIEKVWEGAELTEDYSPNRSTLKVRTESNEVKTLSIKNEKDLPFLRNPPVLIGENDLTSVSYLHEPAVLYNLQVAINPYDNLPIYGTDAIQTYRGQAMSDLNPHIYAEEAYSQLAPEKMDQSIYLEKAGPEKLCQQNMRCCDGGNR